MHGNRATKRLELSLEWGKCTHLYFYWIHEELGFLHLRLQTWFPFLIQVCVNGREWLGRQMDKAGMVYRREENCFPWIGDVGRAQELMEQQQATDWPRVLGKLVEQCHPLHEEISRPIEREYYWTAAQSDRWLWIFSLLSACRRFTIRFHLRKNRPLTRRTIHETCLPSLRP